MSLSIANAHSGGPGGIAPNQSLSIGCNLSMLMRKKLLLAALAWGTFGQLAAPNNAHDAPVCHTKNSLGQNGLSMVRCTLDLAAMELLEISKVAVFLLSTTVF
jgi:hypothetical protein